MEKRVVRDQQNELSYFRVLTMPKIMSERSNEFALAEY